MKCFIAKCDKDRYEGMDKYPNTLIIFGTLEQAQLIADDISNNQAGCSDLFYIESEIKI